MYTPPKYHSFLVKLGFIGVYNLSYFLNVRLLPGDMVLSFCDLFISLAEISYSPTCKYGRSYSPTKFIHVNMAVQCYLLHFAVAVVIKLINSGTINPTIEATPLRRGRYFCGQLVHSLNTTKNARC